MQHHKKSSNPITSQRDFRDVANAITVALFDDLDLEVDRSQGGYRITKSSEEVVRYTLEEIISNLSSGDLSIKELLSSLKIDVVFNNDDEALTLQEKIIDVLSQKLGNKSITQNTVGATTGILEDNGIGNGPLARMTQRIKNRIKSLF